MTALRAKDLAFLGAFIPAALAAAYIYLWRGDASRDAARLQATAASLVSQEDFAFEQARAARAAEAAAKELADEKAAPEPETLVECRADATAASRELAVLDVLRSSGLVAIRSESPQNDTAANAAEALVASGALRTCALRRWTLDGSYPAVKKALAEFAARRMPAIPVRLERGAANRWTLELLQ